ncbi:MAG TPA: hypothetical protein VF320_02625 [Acidimicrobiales bacterium]
MTSEATRVLRNTFYASVGFGVLAFQKAQVRRREVEATIKPQVEAVGRHLRVVHPRSTTKTGTDRR